DQALAEQQRRVDSLKHDSTQKDKKIASLSKERDTLSKERDTLSKERDTLSKERDTLSQERDYLKAQVEMLKRMQFGQKRERFEGDPNQTALPFEAEPAEVEQLQEEIKENVILP